MHECRPIDECRAVRLPGHGLATERDPAPHAGPAVRRADLQAPELREASTDRGHGVPRPAVVASTPVTVAAEVSASPTEVAH